MAIAYILRKTSFLMLTDIPILGILHFVFAVPLPDPRAIFLLNLMGAILIGFLQGDLCINSNHEEEWR